MKSNLSKYNFNLGNHMVTAVTEQSINNTVKQFISNTNDVYVVYTLCTFVKHDGGTDIVYFKVDQNTDVVRDLPEAFPEELRKKDLFSELESLNAFIYIDNPDAEEAKAVFEKMYNYYYVDSFFRITTGIPNVMMRDKNKFKSFNPVVLKESIEPSCCEAEYTQLFKEIEIVELLKQRADFIVTIKKQSKDSEDGYWGVTYLSYLNAHSTKFDDLPEEYKNELRNNFDHISDNDISTMFDISKLIFDLSALSCVSQPKIVGVSSSTEINVLASMNDFVETYFANTFSAGYVVTANEKNTKNYLFKPTKYIYTVSKNGNGNDAFRTLNYVLSTDPNRPITPIYYDWDWMQPSEVMTKSGVVVINRDLFFGKFNNEFKENVIPKLRKHFIAILKGDHKTVFDMEYQYKVENDVSKDNGSFSFSELDKTFHYPEYSYQSTSDFISVYVPPCFAATGQLEFDYSFECSSKWGEVEKEGVKYPAILYKTNVKLYADIEYDSGHSKGYIYNHTLNFFLGFAVKNNGNIEIIKQVQDTDNGSDIDISAWSKFASFGGINGLIKDVSDEVTQEISDIVEDFKNNFLTSFSCVSNWVLIGGKTFAFADENFTEFGDFYADVQYTSPK